MATFAQFRTGVLGFYNPGGTTAQMAYDAIASYVKYKIEREVNQDLERSKSYLGTFLERKVELAGATPPSFGTAEPEVDIRITVDAQRTAIANFVDAYIQEAIDDMTGANASFEAYLKAGCMDIQRHVMCYQAGNQNTFKFADILNTGFASEIDLTSLTGLEIIQVQRARYEAALAAQAYALDDLVESNGRIYKCTTAGTVATVGDGLTNLDDTEQFIDGTGFTFDERIVWRAAESFSWLARDELTSNRAPGGPYYVVDPQVSRMLVYPPMTDENKHQWRITWNGFKQTFSDVDVVPYDVPMQEAVAHYVKGQLLNSIAGDRTNAGVEAQLYAQAARHLWLDCQRKTNTQLVTQGAR